MAGVFKAGRGGYYPVQPTTDTVVIDNSIKVKPVAPQAPLQETVTAGTAENTAVTDEASAKHRQELEQEKEKITSYYREQGEKALADAREKHREYSAKPNSRRRIMPHKQRHRLRQSLKKAGRTALRRVTRTDMPQGLTNAVICSRRLKGSASRW